MKKITIKLFQIKKTCLMSILIASLSITSCQEYLDTPSYDTLDTETVFLTEASADLFVQGCYRNLIHSEMFYQLGAGETVTHSAEDGTTNNSKYNIANYFYDPIIPYTVTTIFKEQYRIIEATNIAISRIGKMPVTDKTKSMIGEAKAIRAFCYYNLIRIYGDVPAVWTPLEEMDPNDPNTFYPKRSPRDEIYDHIVADLQSAVQDIPWQSASGYPTAERLSKQGTYALLARVALYAGGHSLRWNLQTNDPSTLLMSRRSDTGRADQLYQIANDACQAVISQNENSLVQAQGNKSGFEYLWYNFAQRNFAATKPEMLWEIANLGPNTNSDFGVYAHPGSRGGVFGSRKALQFMLPTYYLSFNPSDTRRDVSCTSYSIYFLNGGAATDKWVDVGTTYSCIMPGKFRISWAREPQAANQRNINIPVLRYSDVLLMYAETQNYINNGPTAEAKNALQQVRSRAGIGSLAIPTGKQAFEDAIVQERKWEFAGEFNLRTDLIRMNRLASELAATKQSMKDLSDKKNAYANVSTHRLYKFRLDAQAYGDPFLAIQYIDLTDPAEIASIQTIPTVAAQYPAFLAKTAAIAQAHGFTVAPGEMWYPARMFEAYTSAYNGNARKTVGFTAGFNVLQIGAIIYTKPTGSAENGGTYPNWIEAPDGSDGLYYGFQQNKTELLPFANKAAGHPMIDNPNLTQHPGYK